MSKQLKGQRKCSGKLPTATTENIPPHWDDLISELSKPITKRYFKPAQAVLTQAFQQHSTHLMRLNRRSCSKTEMFWTWGIEPLKSCIFGGHSPGCIALYAPRSDELFSGDIVYDGDLLDQLPGSDIPTYIATYERLQRLPIETVYPGHYHSFGCQRLQQLMADYLEAKRRPGCPSEQMSPVEVIS